MAKRGIKKGGKTEKPVWGEIVKVIDTRTGEERAGWLPLDDIEKLKIREAGYSYGSMLSAVFDTDRNLLNFRQTHALAEFVRDNTNKFPQDMDSHTVLKRIQVEADIECELVEEQAYIEGLGWIPIKRRVAASLAFDRMKQEVWRDVFKRFKDYCIHTYFPGWGPAEIAEFEDILRGNQRP